MASLRRCSAAHRPDGRGVPERVRHHGNGCVGRNWIVRRGAAETIATVDTDGVVFASIQGYADRLAARNRELRAAVAALDDRIDAVRSRLDAITEAVEDGD